MVRRGYPELREDCSGWVGEQGSDLCLVRLFLSRRLSWLYCTTPVPLLWAVWKGGPKCVRLGTPSLEPPDPWGSICEGNPGLLCMIFRTSKISDMQHSFLMMSLPRLTPNIGLYLDGSQRQPSVFFIRMVIGSFLWPLLVTSTDGEIRLILSVL